MTIMGASVCLSRIVFMKLIVLSHISSTEGLGIIDIAKHRNGPTGEIYFRHDKSMTKLVDYEPDLEWMKKNTTR